ncbi:MAG TPA: hypothetical protein VHZ24_19680 [Pirellulales bacterium]|nr:hypothetical protein [Pirellulales bacterium]
MRRPLYLIVVLAAAAWLGAGCASPLGWRENRSSTSRRANPMRPGDAAAPPASAPANEQPVEQADAQEIAAREADAQHTLQVAFDATAPATPASPNIVTIGEPAPSSRAARVQFSDDESQDGEAMSDGDGDGTTDEPETEQDYLKIIDPEAEQLPAPPGASAGAPPAPAGALAGPPAPDDIGLQPGPALPIGNNTPVTLHLDNVDVRKVLEMLSRDHAVNMLVSPNVAGSVTADLSGLTIEQTIDAILRSCSLAARNENGVLHICTPEELRAWKLANGRGEPLGMRIYKLNYTRSTDLLKILKPFLSPQGQITASPAAQVGIRPINPISGQAASSGGGSSSSGGGGGGGSGGGGGGGGSSGSSQQSLSGGDSYAIQEALLIEDRESILVKIDKIVAELDAQPQQVLIEAVILFVTRTDGTSIGFNYGILDTTGNVLGVVGNGAAINAATGFLPSAAVTAAGLLQTPASSSSSGGSSSSSSGGTGFAGNTQGLNIGNTNSNVTSFISFLETMGKVEVLATPRLLVINKQLAELQLGDRLGYSTFSQSLVSTTQQISFMNVGTLLRVRPFIANDGIVRMEVHPERSTGSIVNGIPQASTSEVTTNVMVPDGATLIIGGLIDKQTEVDQNGIPILGTLPYVGVLFRQRNTNIVKKELVVLLTTRIWNPVGNCPISYDDGFPSPDGKTATDPRKMPTWKQGRF